MSHPKEITHARKTCRFCGDQFWQKKGGKCRPLCSEMCRHDEKVRRRQDLERNVQVLLELHRI